MHRQALSVAAVVCLTMTACSTVDPADTAAPTGVATSEVTPSTADTPEAENSATGSPVASGTEPAMAETPAEGTGTPVTPSTASSPAEAGATGRDVDLADHVFAITPQQAIEMGMAETGKGIVHSIELDWSQRKTAWVYEIDILVGTVDHDVDVHADTGEILEQERDTTNDKKMAINLDSPMMWETARDKALDTVQGRIISWKLEWDNTRVSYEFDIEDSAGDQAEVAVDVETGDVRLDD